MHAWLLSCFLLLSVVDHLAKYLAMRLALESQQDETGEWESPSGCFCSFNDNFYIIIYYLHVLINGKVGKVFT